MADAYRCDRCDEYGDGDSHDCYAGESYGESIEAELCDECATVFLGVAGYFLEGDDDE